MEIKGRIFTYIEIAGAGVIGFGLFLYIFGISVLNPANVDWILTYLGSGNDATAQIIGVNAYVNGRWQFPVFLFNEISYPAMQSILTTDSIPLLALPAKIFRFILPTPFQYWGIYLCVNLVLQGVFGIMIMRDITSNKVYKYCGTLILIMSPIMLYCMPAHNALSSHWLILASIIVLGRDMTLKKRMIYWSIVLTLALFIHVYIFVMVGAIFTMSVWKEMLNRYNSSRSEGLIYKELFLGVALIVAIALVELYILGIFSIKMEPSTGAYGTLQMNLNSLINPYCSEYSGLVKAMPHTENQQIEGFNYLGLGVIILLLFYSKSLLNLFLDSEWIKKNYCVIIICIMLTLFALSNRIVIGNCVLIDIMLPTRIKSLCSVLRASGRMFWPVYYLIVIGVLKLAFEDKLKWRGVILIGLITIIQIKDIGDGIINAKWYEMYTMKNNKQSLKVNHNFKRIARPYKHLFYFDYAYWDILGWYAVTNNMTVNDSFFPRESIVHQKILDQEKNKFMHGQYNDDSLYVINESIYQHISKNKSLYNGRLIIDEGMYIFAPYRGK